jgi:two-component system, cell cycle sensor histidine kinase and response regulator CckA
MDDVNKTKEQLLIELKNLRTHVSRLKKSEAKLKVAEESLQEEAIRRRILVEQSRDGIVVMDQSGKVYESNLRYAEMLGYSMKEMLSLHVWDWDTHWPKEQLLEMIGNVDEKGDHFETTHRRKNGTVIDIEISSNGAVCGGKKLVFCVCRDISKRKHAEREKKKLEEQLHHSQKLEAIGTLAAGVAHDFNNILGIILGFAELTYDMVPQTVPVHDKIQQIILASHRAKDIIRQLLTFSRKMHIDRAPVDPSLVVKDALKFLRSSLPSTIDLRHNLPFINGTILADPTQIHQVMMNLCSNAAQAMEQTGGVIEVNAESVTLDADRRNQFLGLPEGDYFKLTVSDTGSGIEPDIIDRIFDPYFTTKEIGKGSGMGLAVVHGIVKNHNGAISVSSSPGNGAVFTILIPLLKNKKVYEKHKEPPLPQGRERILFVDDEAAIVSIAQSNLEELGYAVETALTPQEALNAFRRNARRFDLIITDMTLPKMNGEALFREMRKICKDVRGILCTGYSTITDERRAKQLGFSDFLLKPLSKRDIACAVRKVLDE